MGNQPDRDTPMKSVCAQWAYIRLPTRAGQDHPYRYTHPGAEVHGVVHKVRSLASENFNEQFQRKRDGADQPRAERDEPGARRRASYPRALRKGRS